MDSRIGLDYIVENSDYTSKLGAGTQQRKRKLINSFFPLGIREIGARAWISANSFSDGSAKSIFSRLSKGGKEGKRGLLSRFLFWGQRTFCVAQNCSLKPMCRNCFFFGLHEGTQRMWMFVWRSGRRCHITVPPGGNEFALTAFWGPCLPARKDRHPKKHSTPRRVSVSTVVLLYPAAIAY